MQRSELSPPALKHDLVCVPRDLEKPRRSSSAERGGCETEAVHVQGKASVREHLPEIGVGQKHAAQRGDVCAEPGEPLDGRCMIQKGHLVAASEPEVLGLQDADHGTRGVFRGQGNQSVTRQRHGGSDEGADLTWTKEAVEADQDGHAELDPQACGRAGHGHALAQAPTCDA